MHYEYKEICAIRETVCWKYGKYEEKKEKKEASQLRPAKENEKNVVKRAEKS